MKDMTVDTGNTTFAEGSIDEIAIQPHRYLFRSQHDPQQYYRHPDDGIGDGYTFLHDDEEGRDNDDDNSSGGERPSSKEMRHWSFFHDDVAVSTKSSKQMTAAELLGSYHTSRRDHPTCMHSTDDKSRNHVHFSQTRTTVLLYNDEDDTAAWLVSDPLHSVSITSMPKQEGGHLHG